MTDSAQPQPGAGSAIAVSPPAASPDAVVAGFTAAAAQAERIIAAIRPDQMSAPTPCPSWDVRTMINHMASGNRFFAALLTGQPPVDRSGDFLGDDPVGAFRASAAALAAAFAIPGVLAGVHTTPLATLPGPQVVLMRLTELTVHTWDLATATGQTGRLDPALAATAAGFLESIPGRLRGPGRPFAAMVAAPEGADPVARMAAAAGRIPDLPDAGP